MGAGGVAGGWLGGEESRVGWVVVLVRYPGVCNGVGEVGASEQGRYTAKDPPVGSSPLDR